MTYRKLSLRPLNVLLKQALASRMLKRAALGAGALAPAFALANPTGGQVVGGTAGIAAPDSNHTIINQASQSAIINWQQFSIGSNQYVQFIQPDSSSVVLNRVVGGNPSEILGNLSANGQVFLVNPNGVFFGQTATLDVQGLIATTLDIKDSDFLSGHYVFGKGATAPDASVVNQGTISANGGYVVLAGDYVENDGAISAQTGQVVLAAGNQMTLTLNNNSLVSFVVDQATLAQYAGVSNAGTITADGGTVLMTAKVANALTATAVNNSGLVTAHSIQDHNGVIILAAQGGDISESGTLDASATQSGVAGGYIRIRGNAHTDISSTASINAAGDNARGGFVELSGHHLSVQGNVNVGHGGNLLIDPMKLYITSGGASHGSWTSGDWVTTTFIDGQLNAGVSLTLIASNSVAAPGTPPGDTGATAATSITATNTNGNLTIKTGTLQIHSNSPGGSLAASGYCGQGVCTPYVSGPTAYAFTPTAGAIKLSGVTINIKGTFKASASHGTISVGNVTAKAITLGGGSTGYAHKISTKNLTATNGAVAINGGSHASDHVTISGSVSAASSSGSVAGKTISITGGFVSVTGNLTATGTGSAIQIRDYGSAAVGGSVHVGGNISATNGGVSITETGGAGITVSGNINAALGPVSVVAHDSGGTASNHVNISGAVTGQAITISAIAKTHAEVSIASLHATGAGTGDGISVTASDSSTASSGGKINGNGNITADHGGVTLFAKGGQDAGGQITISGNVTAAGHVSVTASNVGSCCGEIKLGNVKGSGIQLSLNEAGTSQGASAFSVGSLTATGATGADSVSVTLSGGGTGITVHTGPVKSSHGNVTFNLGALSSLSASAGITAGGAASIQAKNVTVASAIAAGGAVDISGNQHSLGNVTGKSIHITGTQIATGNLQATGTKSSDSVNLKASIASYGGAATIATGSIKTTGGAVKLTQFHGHSINTGSSGGKISASGVISAGGALQIMTTDSAAALIKGGNVSLAGVKAKSISVQTLARQSANIIATSFHATGAGASSGISLNAHANGGAASGGGNITVSGAGGIVADHGAVVLTANGGGTSGGNVNVTNAVTAGGAVDISATNVGTAGVQLKLGSATGKHVHLDAFATNPGVSAGALTANGAASTDDVAVFLHNGSGGTATAGTIKLTGAVKSSHGSVTVSGGSHGNVTLSGTGGINAARLVTLNGKNISVGGNITGKQVTIAGNASGASGTVTLKNVTATGAGASNGINIAAQNNTGAPEQITTGTLTTTKGNVLLGLGGTHGGGITVNGAIKSGGSVTLYGSGVTNGFSVTGSISAAGNVMVYEAGNIAGSNALKTGNITAGGYANVSVQQNTGASKVVLGNITGAGGVSVTNTDNGTGSATLTVGNVSATDLYISAHAAVAGQTAKVTTGNLSAINSAARAEVSVVANGKNATINTGAITAKGALSPFTGHPTSSNPFYRGAALVNLNTNGSGAAAVTVNGAMTLQGTGKHYAFSGTGSHTYTASGSTGQALLSVNAGTGNVTVTGPIKESGMGVVGAQIVAGKVSLGGSASFAATAGKAKNSGTFVSGSKNITYSESGARLGGAYLNIQDTTGATLGAVTLTGPSARMFVQGGGAITTGAATLNASGVKFTHTASGTDSLGKAVSYSSTESAGNATLFLQAGTSSTPQAVNVQGAITVSGAGKAVVNVQGGTIATKGISVTEAAGKYSRIGTLPTGIFSNSIGGPDPLAPQSSDHSVGGSGNQGLFGLTQGTLNGGIAGVQLQGLVSGSSCGCQPLATSITVGGNISVSAVGEGEVSLTGNSISVTGGITGAATRATVNGKGAHPFMSSSHNYSVAHTVSGSGGVMHVNIRGKQNGTSGSSSNNYSGTAVVGGAISLTGPTASVEIKSGSVTTGNITVTGSGENITVKDVYTPSGTGSTFTLERSGVINWTGIDLEGKSGTGTVKTGNLSATGPLFAAIHIGAGNVSVGSLDVTASSGSVTLLDTRVSGTPLSFTAGDAGIAISDISGTSSAPVFAPATVSGNVNIKASRDAHLLSDINVSGYVLVTAGRDIDDPLPTDIKRFLNQDPHNHGGSSSNDISPLKLSASALALLAGGNIALNDASLKVGSGTVPGVVGDSGAVTLLTIQGLASAGMLPNATFVAGGTLGLGAMTLTGNYLYMEAGSYNLTGPVSVPTSTVVQFAPTVPAGSVGIEPGTSTSSQLNLSGTVLNLFPGTTFLVGDTGASGDMSIGTTGTITLNGGSNFFVDTTGTVTGLDNILSTGLVGNLLLEMAFQTPTASEIQNSDSGTTGDDTTDQKKKKSIVPQEDQGSQGGGTIETDDSPASVCRG